MRVWGTPAFRHGEPVHTMPVDHESATNVLRIVLLRLRGGSEVLPHPVDLAR